MTASSSGSFTRTTSRRRARSDSAQARSASPACEPAAMADAPSPTSAGVFGMARTTGVPSAQVLLEGGERDAGRDRQHALRARPRRRPGRRPARRRASPRSRCPPPRRASSVTSTPGKIVSSSARRRRRRGSTIDRPSRLLAAGLEQPADEGLAHAPAADDLEPSHAARRYRPGSVAASATRRPGAVGGRRARGRRRRTGPTSSYTTSPAATTPPSDEGGARAGGAVERRGQQRPDRLPGAGGADPHRDHRAALLGRATRRRRRPGASG